LVSKFVKYKWYDEGGDSMRCPNCGGTIIGDGYTIIRHCENIIDLPIDVEPDSGPMYCDGSGGIDVSTSTYDPRTPSEFK
jgi:hypothetical protein